jgi:hypothetical protein
MALEQQVNVQELQRLNEAIGMTMEAIRRVAPQLIWLQQQQLSPFGIGMNNPFQYGTPYGVGVGVDPITQQMIQHQILRHLVQSQLGYQPFGAFGQQLGGYGQLGGFGPNLGAFGQHLFGQQLGQVPWQQYTTPWQTQYSPWQQPTPFVNLQQRTF